MCPRFMQALCLSKNLYDECRVPWPFREGGGLSFVLRIAVGYTVPLEIRCVDSDLVTGEAVGFTSYLSVLFHPCAAL